MSETPTYDIFNYMTSGQEIELLYNHIIRKYEKNLEKGYYEDIKDKKETYFLGSAEEIIDTLYLKPVLFREFYSLGYLRAIDILNVEIEKNKQNVYLDKNLAERLYSNSFRKLAPIPLSCLILEQLKKLPENNNNKMYYYTLRKIIFENRLERTT